MCKKKPTSKRVWPFFRALKRELLFFSRPSLAGISFFLIALFVLYAIIECRWTREIYPDLTKSSALTGVLFGLVFNTLRYRSLWDQAVFRTTCFFSSFLKIKKIAKSIMLHFVIIIFFAGIVVSVVSIINAFFDRSTPTVIYSPVIRLTAKKCYGKGALINQLIYGAPYNLIVQVEAYGYAFHTTRILYNQLQIGSIVKLKIHQGFLNSPWISTEIEA